MINGMFRALRPCALTGLLLWCGLNAWAGPGELTVVSVLPMREALADALQKFQSETGQSVAVVYVNRNQLKSKVHGAEHPDVVVASEDEMNGLDQARLVQSSVRSPLARMGLGVSMFKDAVKPDLSTPQALALALRQAKSLTYVDPADSPAGQQAQAVIAQLGLTDELQAKTQLGTGNNPVAPVGFGDVALGLHPMNLILLARGAQLAAPLPAQVQQWTRFDVALIADAPNQNEAKRLITFLTGASARASYAAQAFEPMP